LNRAAAEVLLIRAGALAASLVLFGAFVALAGANPFDVYYQMYRGSFGTSFSVQNTLLRAAPLMLTALCTAVPARLGLMMIGGEGALVIGGLAAIAAGLGLASVAPPFGVTVAIALLNHFVEGPMRDPASLNKPSTRAIPAEDMLQAIPGLEVHWGLVFGIVACVVAHVLMMRSTFGFGAAIAGGNLRAGMLCGLPVRRMMVIASFLGGGGAGLAGMAEVAAVHGRANASLVTGYGYTGILVSFMARHEPLAIIPVALLFGGIGASNGLLQRADNLPDATVAVLQGILFVVILASETLYGRFGFFRPREERVAVRQVAGAAPEAT
jgi:ABC-type uncharacterized transport system permease subunit